jgi:hypothetical protein
VTVSSNVAPSEIEALLANSAALGRCFATGDSSTVADSSISLKSGPEGRGTELHASSHGQSKSELKLGLSRMRSLLETGEIPTGARR